MAQKNITLLKKAWTGVQSITAKITGTNTDAVYVETSDADATAADMLDGKTAYVNASKVTGSIETKASSDLTASGATVTAPAGYYASNATKSVASGTAGTPTAAKGAVSNHSVSVTPSVTNTTGYITGSTKTGTAVTVSASELVSGSETKTANGTYDVTNLSELVVNVSGGVGLTKLVTKDLGTISTSSTSAADTGQTVAVTGFDAYDLLVCIAHTSPHTNNRHVGTVRLINLAATSDVDTKTGTGIATSTQHYKLSSSGVLSCRVGTTPYGVYPNSATLSTSGTRTITLAIYQRYNSTSTGTLNGHYYMDVYGVTLRDML